MTPLGDNVYSYTVDNDSFNMIIFNGNGGSVQTKDADYPGGGKIYDNSTGQWSVYDTSTIQPVISVSKNSGNYKSDTLTVTITAQYADSASYSLDGGSPVGFSGSTNVTIGAGLPIGSKTTLTVTATNSNGTSTETYTYTKTDPTQFNDGSTSPALGGRYSTNPNGGVGVRKTISIDGNKSDWEQSMLVAQGVANDDPRVYCHWSMHERPYDDYALYAAWDDQNLYLMYEMANVQDIVAPKDDFPLSQGNLWIDNIPVFLYVYTGEGNVTHGKTSGGTLWDSGITFDANADHIVAFSTDGSNGPFIYTADDNGNLDPERLVNKNTGMNIKWGNGKTLSGELIGVNKAGTDNGRKYGDTLEESSNWVDFYKLGHKASLDMFYEVSIPLKNLDISASDIENNGIGIMKVSTMGTSGLDCQPYDMSMQDNAAKPYSKDESTSMEKEDSDHITVPMARVGRGAGSNPSTNPTTPIPTTLPSTTVTSQPTQAPPTTATSEPTTSTDAPTPPVSSSTADTQVTWDTSPTYTNPVPTSQDTSSGIETNPTTNPIESSTDPHESSSSSEDVSTGATDTTGGTDPQESTVYTDPSSTNTEPSETTTAPTTPKPKTISSSFKMKAGASKSIKVSQKGVKYSSTKKKVVKVSSKGKVTALTKGTSTVTVKAGTTTYKYKITVTSNPKLSKSKVKVKKGKTVSVTIKGKASGVNNKYRNTKYAKITSKKSAKKIKIRGKKKGSTKLYVTVNGKKLKLKVTVV